MLTSEFGAWESGKLPDVEELPVVEDDCGNLVLSDEERPDHLDLTDAMAYASHQLDYIKLRNIKKGKEEIMKSKKEIVEALNGNNSEACQEVYERKTLRVDLLSLLKDNPVLAKCGFGEDAMLMHFDFEDGEMILTVQEGAVTVPETDSE